MKIFFPKISHSGNKIVYSNTIKTSKFSTSPIIVHISQHGIYERSAPAEDSCPCHEAIAGVSLGSQGYAVMLSNIHTHKHACMHNAHNLILCYNDDDAGQHVK